MRPSEYQSDWLQDTLQDVTRRLRHGGDDLGWCANQLEKIVTGLRYPAEFEDRSTVEESTRSPNAAGPAWRRPLATAALGGVIGAILQRLLTRRNGA